MSATTGAALEAAPVEAELDTARLSSALEALAAAQQEIEAGTAARAVLQAQVEAGRIELGALRQKERDRASEHQGELDALRAEHEAPGRVLATG